MFRLPDDLINFIFDLNTPQNFNRLQNAPLKICCVAKNHKQSLLPIQRARFGWRWGHRLFLDRQIERSRRQAVRCEWTASIQSAGRQMVRALNEGSSKRAARVRACSNFRRHTRAVRCTHISISTVVFKATVCNILNCVVRIFLAMRKEQWFCIYFCLFMHASALFFCHHHKNQQHNWKYCLQWFL